MVIFDNLTSLTIGVPERSPQKWGLINSWLMALRGLGLAVILVHHAVKSGKDRGISDIRTSFENIIRLTRVTENIDEVEIVATFDKGRELLPGESDGINFKLVPGESGGLYLMCN